MCTERHRNFSQLAYPNTATNGPSSVHKAWGGVSVERMFVFACCIIGRDLKGIDQQWCIVLGRTRISDAPSTCVFKHVGSLPSCDVARVLRDAILDDFYESDGLLRDGHVIAVGLYTPRHGYRLRPSSWWLLTQRSQLWLDRNSTDAFCFELVTDWLVYIWSIAI
jgi:hypothetical protein